MYLCRTELSSCFFIEPFHKRCRLPLLSNHHTPVAGALQAYIKPGLFVIYFDCTGMPSNRPLNGVQTHMRPTSSALPGTRPGNPGKPALLSHTLPQMASKAFAGPVSRPLNLNLASRGSVTGSLRGPLPQMSRQAYLQQASAQLQNFQGQSQTLFILQFGEGFSGKKEVLSPIRSL